MPKLSGVFSSFTNLENIPIDQLSHLYKVDPKVLMRRLANLLLYPQIIAQTKEELTHDLAILEGVILLNPQKFYDPAQRKIYIPENYLERFPDLPKLGLAFISSIRPTPFATLISKSPASTKNLGTVLHPEIINKSGQVNVWVDNKKYQLKIGGLMMVKTAEDKLDLKFESAGATVFGNNSYQMEAEGGELGVIIDTR